MQSKEITDAVYSMARLGLTMIAQNTQNGPREIGHMASLLEAWRTSCEAQMAAANKVAAEVKDK